MRLKYINEAFDTIKKDIALTVRATEKAMVDMNKVQKNKLEQVRDLNQLLIKNICNLNVPPPYL